MRVRPHYLAIASACFLIVGCKNEAPPRASDVVTTVSDPVAACKMDLDEVFIVRREMVPPVPPIVQKPSQKMLDDLDKWYDKVDVIIDQPISLPCITDIGISLEDIEDDHALSPEMVGFAYSRARAPVLSMPYIAVLDAKAVSIVPGSVAREEGLDAYGRVKYQAAVIETLRGELSGAVEFEFSKQRNPSYFQGGFKTEVEPNPRLLALCRRADGMLAAYTSISEPYAGPGGIAFMKARLVDAKLWTKGDNCPEPYFSAPP